MLELVADFFMPSLLVSKNVSVNEDGFGRLLGLQISHYISVKWLNAFRRKCDDASYSCAGRGRSGR